MARKMFVGKSDQVYFIVTSLSLLIWKSIGRIPESRILTMVVDGASRWRSLMVVVEDVMWVFEVMN